MRKYLAVLSLSLQNVLQRRASLAMDRVGGLVYVAGMYFFWDSLLPKEGTLMGYRREQMLTYVLMVNVLRSFVFTGRGWEVMWEISSGRLSATLLRPISYAGSCLSQDMAQKLVHLAAAILEVSFLVLVLGARWHAPQSLATWALFGASVVVSSLLFFTLEMLVATLAFWSSESGGPLFCFELLLQFASGAFFPLDVLPGWAQAVLKATPFPYIVFHPLNIYLERVSFTDALSLLALQTAWLAGAGVVASALWTRGVASYGAEGG